MYMQRWDFEIVEVRKEDKITVGDFRIAWRCGTKWGCGADGDGIQCPCGRWRKNHDPGDEA